MLLLKQLREARGLNMRETANLLGIPYTTYVNYEKGLREPTSEMLIALANFFDVTTDYLLGRGYVVPQNPDPVIESDASKDTTNLIRIAARNGSYQERRLSDQQLAALVAILDQMPDVPDDL